MNWQSEEDDRIDDLLGHAEFCFVCNCPIGVGDCDGCIAVSSIDCLDHDDDDR